MNDSNNPDKVQQTLVSPYLSRRISLLKLPLRCTLKLLLVPGGLLRGFQRSRRPRRLRSGPTVTCYLRFADVHIKGCSLPPSAEYSLWSARVSIKLPYPSNSTQQLSAAALYEPGAPCSPTQTGPPCLVVQSTTLQPPLGPNTPGSQGLTTVLQSAEIDIDTL